MKEKRKGRRWEGGKQERYGCEMTNVFVICEPLIFVDVQGWEPQYKWEFNACQLFKIKSG